MRHSLHVFATCQTQAGSRYRLKGCIADWERRQDARAPGMLSDGCREYQAKREARMGLPLLCVLANAIISRQAY